MKPSPVSYLLFQVFNCLFAPWELELVFPLIPPERRWFFSFCLGEGGDGERFGVPGAVAVPQSWALTWLGFLGDCSSPRAKAVT